MDSIEKELSDIGISKDESRIYVALLDMGESTASKISERAGIGRVNTYQILERMINRGLASFIIKNNVKYFNASKPEKLLNDLKDKEEKFSAILPELKSRMETRSMDTRAEIYKGREGINSIFKMILREKKPYYFIGGVQESCNLFRLENTIFVKRAEKAKLKGKILARKQDNFFVGENEEFRYLPENVVLPTTTWTWADKSGILVWKEPYYCILITSEEIAKSNIASFGYLFENAKKPLPSEVKERILK